MVGDLGNPDLRRRVGMERVSEDSPDSQDKSRGSMAGVDPPQLLLLQDNLGSRGSDWSLLWWPD